MGNYMERQWIVLVSYCPLQNIYGTQGNIINSALPLEISFVYN
jgi:hypothetical protein